MDDEAFMKLALELAGEAARAGEVPVGCVITRDGRVVGRGRNRREGARNALCHGELEAIDQACRTLGGWRLWQCTLYVTLEPCPMCSVCDLFSEPFNHHPACTAGVLEEPCAQILRDFFRNLRVELPNRTKWKRPE